MQDAVKSSTANGCATASIEASGTNTNAASLGFNAEANAPKLGKFDPRRYRDAGQVLMEEMHADGLKTQTIIPVKKPPKRLFIRVHPDAEFRVQNLPTIEDNATGDIYLVDADLVLPPDLESKVDFLNLATSMTTDGSLFLWHYKNSTNSWSESARIAQTHAVRGWVRVLPDKSSNGYLIERPLNNPADPAWPALTFPQILETAFGSRCIDSLRHPLLRKLRGDFCL